MLKTKRWTPSNHSTTEDKWTVPHQVPTLGRAVDPAPGSHPSGASAVAGTLKTTGTRVTLAATHFTSPHSAGLMTTTKTVKRHSTVLGRAEPKRRVGRLAGLNATQAASLSPFKRPATSPHTLWSCGFSERCIGLDVSVKHMSFTVSNAPSTLEPSLYHCPTVARRRRMPHVDDPS